MQTGMLLQSDMLSHDSGGIRGIMLQRDHVDYKGYDPRNHALHDHTDDGGFGAELPPDRGYRRNARSIQKTEDQQSCGR